MDRPLYKTSYPKISCRRPGCDVIIEGPAVWYDRKAYCTELCAAGGPLEEFALHVCLRCSAVYGTRKELPEDGVCRRMIEEAMISMLQLQAKRVECGSTEFQIFPCERVGTKSVTVGQYVVKTPYGGKAYETVDLREDPKEEAVGAAVSWWLNTKSQRDGD